jgi:flagellar motor protein MotB
MAYPPCAGFGMTPAPVSRWAVSFADLALLLLGFFVLLYVGRADLQEVAVSTRAALDSEAAAGDEVYEWAGASLFVEGEARLQDSARARLARMGAEAARTGKTVRIESFGGDPAARRFDGWELAAARAAAAARAVREGGLAEEDVEIAMPARNDRKVAHRLIVRVEG